MFSSVVFHDAARKRGLNPILGCEVYVAPGSRFDKNGTAGETANHLVLLAENDGGEGLDYEWLASVGRIDRLAPDVIAWTLQEGDPDPFIQAAVSGPNAAAVASFAFNDRAA